MAHARKLCELCVSHGRRAADLPGWPAQLRRVEAVEPVMVRRWEVGIADSTVCTLDAADKLAEHAQAEHENGHHPRTRCTGTPMTSPLGNRKSDPFDDQSS